jgi:hypothetical protein
MSKWDKLKAEVKRVVKLHYPGGELVSFEIREPEGWMKWEKVKKRATTRRASNAKR